MIEVVLRIIKAVPSMAKWHNNSRSIRIIPAALSVGCQVVVAVLLDNFTAAADKEKERMAQEQRDKEGRIAHTAPLDPLLGALAHFDTSTDLLKRINLLFEMLWFGGGCWTSMRTERFTFELVLDVDDNGTLSYEEIQQGLKKLRVEPAISLTPDDFENITQ
eukprot:922496-Rhodomonas_salina.1